MINFTLGCFLSRCFQSGFHLYNVAWNVEEISHQLFLPFSVLTRCCHQHIQELSGCSIVFPTFCGERMFYFSPFPFRAKSGTLLEGNAPYTNYLITALGWFSQPPGDNSAAHALRWNSSPGSATACSLGILILIPGPPSAPEQETMGWNLLCLLGLLSC